MSELPEGWEWSTLGDVAEVIAGPAFKSKEFVDLDDGVALLRGDNIEPGKLRWRGVRAWPSDKLDGLDHLYVREGDVILAMDRPVVTAGLKLARVTSADPPALLVQRVARIRANIDFVPGFVYALLQQGAFVGHLLGGQTGTQIPHVNLASIRGYAIPVPPLPEQRRIVVAIEEHFSRLDAAETDLHVALARTTLLMQATLIATIPCTVVPDGWEVTTVDEAGATDLGRQRAPKYHSGDSMRPYLRVANVFEDRLDLSDVMEMDFDDDAWAKYRLVDGDILLNEGQSPHLVGRPAMYCGNPGAIAFTNSLIRFRAHDDVDSEWALLVFRRHLHARRFMAEASITTNIAHLALKRFRTVEFPKPPLAEQRRLVAQIRHDLDAIDRMRSEIQGVLRRLAATRRSILAAAFSGQLVPQDPTDEPASVLLERIAVKRAASKPTRKKKAAS